MAFCSDFDQALAATGAAAVFLPDREGLLRFDAEWTRGAWGRLPGEHPRAPAWALLRDHDTGFVLLVYTTARSLLAEHPRMDVRLFDDRVAAETARATFGDPPVTQVAW